MTLLRQIQLLLERTYGSTGVNFEEFIIGSERYRRLAALADASVADMSDLGRVFLRVTEGQLAIGIYYDERVIHALEARNPQCGVTDANVGPFMVFLEELDHAVHAALKFRDGVRDIDSESFACDLELQARVDMYLILQMYRAGTNRSRRLTHCDRQWLRNRLFDMEDCVYADPVLGTRYREGNRLGRRYARYLDTLTADGRPAEIRAFRRLTFPEKRALIDALAV
jgi:hypothetical protein